MPTWCHTRRCHAADCYRFSATAPTPLSSWRSLRHQAQFLLNSFGGLDMYTIIMDVYSLPLLVQPAAAEHGRNCQRGGCTADLREHCPAAGRVRGKAGQPLACLSACEVRMWAPSQPTGVAGLHLRMPATVRAARRSTRTSRTVRTRAPSPTAQSASVRPARRMSTTTTRCSSATPTQTTPSPSVGCFERGVSAHFARYRVQACPQPAAAARCS